MKLACNCSRELMQLLAAGEVDVDYLKLGLYGEYPEMFEAVRRVKPVLLHGLGFFEEAGVPDLSAIDKDFVNGWISRCGSPHYALHMGIQNKHMPPGMTDEDIHARMLSNVLGFKEGLSVPLLLESSPDCPTDRNLFDHYPYCLPERVCRLVYEADTLYLLDIAHIKVTAQYLGVDMLEYFSLLPLDRVKEIHVVGTGFDMDGFPKDTHGALEDEDFGLIEWVLERTSPDLVTLEYGSFEASDKGEIKRQLLRLSKMIEGSL